jgi:hypothetical protein
MAGDYRSGEERRKAYREAYKAQLKQQRETLKALNRRRAQQSYTEAMGDLARYLENTDDTDQWTERLNRETALNEAKLDMAVAQDEDAGGPQAPYETPSSEEPTAKHQPPYRDEAQSESAFDRFAKEMPGQADYIAAPSEPENTPQASQQKKSLGIDLADEASTTADQPPSARKTLGGLPTPEERAQDTEQADDPADASQDPSDQ